MKKYLKPITYFVCFSIFIVSITGCDKFNNKINYDSPLANAKKVMVESLDNFSYDANITVKTGIMNVTTTMECREDRKNEVGYCKTSTYGVQTEEYIDYKNKIDYSKVYSPYSTDASNGIWTKTKIESSNTNSWLNLSDYVFNITEESKNDGTYYTGTINSKKLAAAISTMNSDIDMDGIVSDDIDITVLVNRFGYIEKITFDMEIMGLDEYVEINYKDYNSSGNITIPNEVKEK